MDLYFSLYMFTCMYQFSARNRRTRNRTTGILLGKSRYLIKRRRPIVLGSSVRAVKQWAGNVLNPQRRGPLSILSDKLRIYRLSRKGVKSRGWYFGGCKSIRREAGASTLPLAGRAVGER